VSGHAEARDPMHARTWVVLADGARHQLDLIRDQAARRRARIHIVIDLCRARNYADDRAPAVPESVAGAGFLRPELAGWSA
jgi:hypothetical protein